MGGPHGVSLASPKASGLPFKRIGAGAGIPYNGATINSVR